jgi:hypothetical protein
MPKHTLYTPSEIDNTSAAYFAYIYQKYIKENSERIDMSVREALPKGTPESTKIVLEWFFSNQDTIETWYQENNISYENEWVFIISSEINNLLLNPDNKANNFLRQGTSLQQLLSPYALRKEADFFYSNYQQFGFKEASKTAITNTIKVFQEKILLIENAIENHEGSYNSKERKAAIINNFITLSIDSVARYIRPSPISEEEQVGIMQYVAQMQLYLEPYTSFEKFNDEEIDKIIDAATSPKNLNQSVSNGVNYGKKLLKTLTTRSFSKVYLYISQRENTADADDALVCYLAYKLHQEFLKRGLLTAFLQLGKLPSHNDDKDDSLTTYLKSRGFPNPEEYEQVYRNARIEYETNTYHQRLKEKGKRVFKSLTKKAEPTKIAMLKAYILLSLHKNRIKEKHDSGIDILIRRLLDCLGGDIKNKRAVEYPEIHLEDLTRIYISNPEIRDYLLAFIEALDEIPVELEESREICIKQYSLLKNVIFTYEKRKSNDSLQLFSQLPAVELPALIPSEQTESTTSLDTPSSISSYEDTTTNEDASDSDDSGDSLIGIAALEETHENYVSLDGESNFQDGSTFNLLEENSAEIVPHADDLVSDYEQRLVDAYCVYNLAETPKSPENPQATGKRFAWEFIFNAQNKGVTLFEIIYNNELPTSTYSSKQLDEFWSNFFSEITDPMRLGQYDEVFTEICKKDYTFFTLLLAYHTQKLPIALKEIRKIGLVLNEEQLFLAFFNNIIKTLEEDFQEIDKKSYLGSLGRHMEAPPWASTSAQRYKILHQKIKQINQLPSKVSILSKEITDLFIQCNTLENILKPKLEELNYQAGQETAIKFFTTSFCENFGKILTSLTLKEQAEEFVIGFMEVITKKIVKNETKMEHLFKTDSTFAALYLACFFNQYNILNDILRNNLTFNQPLFNSIMPKIIPKLIAIWKNEFGTIKQGKENGADIEPLKQKFDKVNKQISAVYKIIKNFSYSDNELKNLRNEVDNYGEKNLGISHKSAYRSKG